MWRDLKMSFKSITYSNQSTTGWLKFGALDAAGRHFPRVCGAEVGVGAIDAGESLAQNQVAWCFLRHVAR